MRRGDNMNFGVDYLDTDGETISYLIVEADDIDEAHQKAGKLLNEYGLPRRNILFVEGLDWLER